MDLLLLHSKENRLRKICIGANDGARIGPRVLPVPYSRLCDPPFYSAASWFPSERGVLASLSDRRHSEGSETGLREEGPRFFLGIGEIRVQGVRLRKQKHLRKNPRLQFHVLLISSLTGMPGGERARHCRRLGGAPWGECPVYPVLTRCPGLRAPDGTRQTTSLVS